MKIKDLIAELQRHDPHFEAVVAHGERIDADCPNCGMRAKPVFPTGEIDRVATVPNRCAVAIEFV